MKKSTLLILAVLALSFDAYSQSNDPNEFNNNDLLQIEEQLPKSPEAARLGEYGALSATPYNGKANVSIPIHTINFEGLQIPISLSYDTGGVRVSQEASAVGLNWNLSTNYGITRQIFGISDFGSRVGSQFDSQKTNGYIFNDLNVYLPEGSFQPRHDFDQIYDVHYSLGLRSIEGSEAQFLDTQPDLFTLNTFNKSYKFILKKKGATNSIETHIFNSNTAQITFDLDSLSFTVIDDMGFTYIFQINEVSTPISTIQNNASSPPGGEAAAYTYLFSGEHATVNSNSLPTTWGLTTVTSPTGRVINFNYGQQGLYFTFPQYSFDNRGQDEESFSWSEFRTRSLYKTNHNVSTTIIERDYLTEISGDFGRVVFNLDGRLDLSTGNTLDHMSDGAFGPNVLQTKFNTIRSCHGTGENCGVSTSILPLKLSGLFVENSAGRKIVDVSFQQSYFNEGNNDAVPERYLRLKLDGVTINERSHTFSYIEPNNMAAKDSDGVDFWGFANGKENTNDGLVPRIGRFTTKTCVLPPFIVDLGQQFTIFDGADRSAHFNFGKRGTLNGIVYPTGGASELVYEPHDVVLAHPRKFETLETWPGYPDSYRWTDMVNEANFDNTYHYLKNSKDPSYNYVQYEPPVNQGNPIQLDFQLNQIFNVTFPSSVEVNAALRVETGLAGLAYWGNEVLIAVQEVNTGNEYPLIYYKDAPNVQGGDPLPITNTAQIPPGSYRLVRKSIYVPGGNYQDYPPTPAISINNPVLTVFTFESPEDAAGILERFEIGGLRIKSILNKDINGDFINGKEYDYDFPDGFEGLSSSGKLMDELVFYSKTNGFYSYNPRFSRSFSLKGSNVVGGQPSAQGCHLGYSNVREYQVNQFGENLGWVERQYENVDNEYFTDSFTLPYMFDALSGNGDNTIEILGLITTNWFCSGLDLGNNCSGDKQWSYSLLDNVNIQNTKVLGLPLRLSFNHSNGNVLKEIVYDQTGFVKSITENQYTLLQGDLPNSYFSSFKNFPITASSPVGAQQVAFSLLNVATVPDPRSLGGATRNMDVGVMPWGMNHSTYYPYQFPQHYGQVSKMYSSKTILFERDKQIAKENISIYDEDTHLMKENSLAASDQKNYRTVLYYPYDPEVVSQPGVQDLLSENQWAIPVLTENYVEDKLMTSKQNEFAKNSNTNNYTLPIKVSTLKGPVGGAASFEPRMLYEKYGAFGNILQSRKEDGSPISYIWGYNDSYPVAKVENAILDDLGTYTNQIASATDLDNDRTKDVVNNDGSKNYVGREGTIRSLLDELRQSLPNAMITSYTYDPMLGQTSFTDPKGYTTYYDYDDQNRLVNITDERGNLMEDFDYEYSDGRFNGSFSESPYVSPDAGGNVQQEQPISARIAYGNSDVSFQTFNALVSGGDGGTYTYEWFLSVGSSSTNFEPNPVSTASTYTLFVDCDEYRYVKLVVTNGGETDSDTKINGNAPCDPGEDPNNPQ